MESGFIPETVIDALYSKMLGQAILEYAKHYDPSLLSAQMEGEAMKILQEIKFILDDKSLSDPECFGHISEIVDTLYRHGFFTSRHEDLV